MPDLSGNLTPEEKLKIALGLHPTQQPNPLAGGVPQNEASNAPPTLGGGGGQPAPVSPMSAPAAPTKPVVAAPVQPAATALNVPKIGAQRQADETELQRLNSTGSGVSQLAQRHPILGTMARVGSAIGSAMFPSIASAIPGTELHHSALVNRAQGNVNQDIKGEEANAGMAKDAAQTNEATARAEALQHPKPEKLDNPQAATFQSLIDKGIDPMEAFKQVLGAENAAKPEKPEKPDAIEQQYQDAIQRGDHETAERLLKVMRDVAAAKQAPERPERPPHQMVVGPDGTVMEVRPGDKIPAGSKTTAKYGEPTADESRRADLAKNLEENLATLEDIVKRRPELFGPAAGRLTGARAFIGTDDKDIAALQTIKHQIGMAQISAHGMRSSHGIDGAADSILNGFHNEPEAMLGAIQAARNSVNTFKNDVTDTQGFTQHGKPKQQGGTADPLGIR